MCLRVLTGRCTGIHTVILCLCSFCFDIFTVVFHRCTSFSMLPVLPNVDLISFSNKSLGDVAE